MDNLLVQESYLKDTKNAFIGVKMFLSSTFQNYTQTTMRTEKNGKRCKNGTWFSRPKFSLQVVPGLKQLVSPRIQEEGERKELKTDNI